MLIFYLFSVAKIILVLILNLFNLIDGPHQVDSPQTHHCDANKEDEVHVWQAHSCTPGGGSKEHEVEPPVEVPMEEPLEDLMEDELMDEETEEGPMFEEPRDRRI